MNVFNMWSRVDHEYSLESQVRGGLLHQPPLIALFEPDQGIRDLMRDVLSTQGYRVYAALPDTGVQDCVNLHPQAAIVDIGPVVGCHCKRAMHDVRANLGVQHLPLLFTTTSSFVDQATTHYLAEHNCELLFQPFELDALMNWLSRRLPLERCYGAS